MADDVIAARIIIEDRTSSGNPTAATTVDTSHRQDQELTGIVTQMKNTMHDDVQRGNNEIVSTLRERIKDLQGQIETSSSKTELRMLVQEQQALRSELKTLLTPEEESKGLGQVFKDIRRMMHKDSTFGVPGGSALGGLASGAGGTTLAIGGSILAGVAMWFTGHSFANSVEGKTLQDAISKWMEPLPDAVENSLVASVQGFSALVPGFRLAFGEWLDGLQQEVEDRQNDAPDAGSSDSFVDQARDNGLPDLNAIDIAGGADPRDLKTKQENINYTEKLSAAEEEMVKILEDGVVTEEEMVRLNETRNRLEDDRAGLMDKAMTAMENQYDSAQDIHSTYQQWLDRLIEINGVILANKQAHEDEATAIENVNTALAEKIRLEKSLSKMSTSDKKKGISTIADYKGKTYEGTVVQDRALNGGRPTFIAVG